LSAAIFDVFSYMLTFFIDRHIDL